MQIAPRVLPPPRTGSREWEEWTLLGFFHDVTDAEHFRATLTSPRRVLLLPKLEKEIQRRERWEEEIGKSLRVPSSMETLKRSRDALRHSRYQYSTQLETTATLTKGNSQETAYLWIAVRIASKLWPHVSAFKNVSDQIRRNGYTVAWPTIKMRVWRFQKQHSHEYFRITLRTAFTLSKARRNANMFSSLRDLKQRQQHAKLSAITAAEDRLLDKLLESPAACLS